jgi:uncharacterized protein YjbJ (UPF0337 family)
MYADLLRGKWTRLRRHVKRKWNLSDIELDQIEGREDKLLEILQNRFGLSRDKAEQEYNEFIVVFERRHLERKEMH